MAEDIQAQVREVVVEKLGVREEEVTLDSSFMEDLRADSLDVVELIMALEDKFGIDIPDEEVPELQTFGDAVRYIEKKSGG
ncbi:MAG: acyl carrier protein [Fimbriimonadaceae bacterium]|jgi:acyl carrier protein